MDLTQFADCYRGRRVLVTGHTGFKGSWLALWLQQLGARVAGLALDPEPQSHWSLLGLTLERDARIDVRHREALVAEVAAFGPEIVFHLAAQALVRRGYRDPAATWETNVLGAVNVCEAVRSCGSVRAMVNVTTDKVYEEDEGPGGHVESDPLGGHDPYSASKAASELVSASYRRSYLAASGVRSATARAGNVIGGGDWAEDRLVPDLMRSARARQPLRLRHPGAVRPWQHVLEPLCGYLRLGQGLLAGEPVEGAWNFAPALASTVSVEQLVSSMARHWPGLQVEIDAGEHPREAARLVLDNGKARRELRWAPVWDFDRTVERVATWYRTATRAATLDDLAGYVNDARAAGREWVA